MRIDILQMNLKAFNIPETSSISHINKHSDSKEDNRSIQLFVR